MQNQQIHTYEERAALTKNLTAQKLFHVMAEKESNLSVAADAITSQELLEIADRLGPELCLLKTHIDIIKDFTPDLTRRLRDLAERHNFLIFEDRKFADIGNTVKEQYQGGIYHISEWADIINAHPIPGPGIVEGLQEIGLPKQRALLLLAEMSSQGTLAIGEYTRKTVEMAEAYPSFVIGFICRQRLSSNPGLIHMTPGVSASSTQDLLGQRYLTPETVIGKRGCDIMIVGRGITKADFPIKEALKYRKAGWQAYTNSL